LSLEKLKALINDWLSIFFVKSKLTTF